jgi:isopentenyl-diphosphate delta-isomerase
MQTREYALPARKARGNFMPNKKEMVILVNNKDRKIGLKEKLEAHNGKGKLHRAISVFVFNSKGQIMLQRRALSKYHSIGQWANTCCSHPYDKEPILKAGHRRLMQEMGFDCKLKETFSFIYHANVGNGLRENEYDHVLFGFYDGKPKQNPKEVSDWKFVGIDKLMKDIKINPKTYVPWLRIIIKRVSRKYKELKKHKNL